ncbi:monovalent cation:proton antiporter-2 (CPA2) family protein [Hydrocarboniphaga effusa]|uniref:monovalent cation:proton antiporter-2 (CPA2) family protein n=1 Tax=Hydrocarboniphaga effusa TaxID=243629 RepID=UPI00398BC2D6
MTAQETAAHGFDLVPIVALLGAGVVAAPLFKRLGLGSVLGYLAAGLAIGPFGLGLFSDAQAILHVAELGVVLFLFVIGLEMQPTRLWAMRGEIFGLGLAQLLVCMGLLCGVGVALGYPLAASLIAGTGFVLTSTAIVMQVLEERRTLNAPSGRKIVAVLLLEDLAIVPLLALVAFLAPSTQSATMTERFMSIFIGLAAVGALIAAGRWLLDPLFRLLATSRAREVMTAAALLVVLGAALLMQLGGLSMAMGAFLAGVLLSESAFRHQLEADIEPFRGILLGLFFLGVGMALDLSVVAHHWRLIAISVVAYMLLKMLGIYVIARLFGSQHRQAIERAVLMAQGGEFAFVLYAAAAAVGIIDAEGSALLTATIIVSMALTPLMIIAHDKLMPKIATSLDGVEHATDLESSVLVIGFGRFGQIVSQPLIAQGCSLSIIETDAQHIRDSEAFGFKVYYGDGTRLDILHAAGAHHARLVVVATDDKQATLRIVELVKAEFPLVPVLARAFDREHVLELEHAGADYYIRETFESALAMAGHALEQLGQTPEEAAESIADFRRRDADRLALELAGGLFAGRALIVGNLPIRDLERNGT